MSKTSDTAGTIEPDAGATVADDSSEVSVAAGKRVALAGRLGGMNRREATSLLRSYQATVVDLGASSDWIVIGAEESPLAEAELLSRELRDAAAAGELEILHETELWQRLGLVEVEQSVRQYHTPAMLAHLLGVSVRVIRRWQRRGLITPVRTLHKLPYFDFQEVATARRLAQWVASGASPQAIEHRLVELVEVLPDIQRPLDQLSIIVEGEQILLRQGEGLIEPGGQLRFDFSAMEDDDEENSAAFSLDDSVLSISGSTETSFPLRESPEAANDELLAAAFAAEDAEDLETAIDYCHAVLARDGARADISFQLAELLYRNGQLIAARERYYNAIELDPEFVEARASLGSLLAETGQKDLAVAAFRGALSLHDDYPDVHYNLARTLDELQCGVEANHHWQRFLELAPDSPWAFEARERLDMCDS